MRPTKERNDNESLINSFFIEQELSFRLKMIFLRFD